MPRASEQARHTTTSVDPLTTATAVLAGIFLVFVTLCVCAASTHAVYAWGRPLEGIDQRVRRVYYDERTQRFFDV